MSKRIKDLLITIAIWHLICLVMFFVFQYFVGRIVVAVYTAWFGDIQQSYGRYERIGTYFEFVVITSPASLLSLRLFNGLSRRKANWAQTFITFVGWEFVAVAVLIGSYEAGFSYMIHQLDWAIFGPNENLYSFRNLMVHRIIAWLLCTTPVAWIALWVHRKLTSQTISMDDRREQLTRQSL